MPRFNPVSLLTLAALLAASHPGAAQVPAAGQPLAQTPAQLPAPKPALKPTSPRTRPTVVAPIAGTPAAAAAPSASADSDDGRKARLLYAMATWVWPRTANAAKPLPPLDTTSVAGFQKTVAPLADLNRLTESVRGKLSGKSFATAPLSQVETAVGQVVTDRSKSLAKSTADLPALLARLAGIVRPPAPLAPDSLADAVAATGVPITGPGMPVPGNDEGISVPDSGPNPAAAASASLPWMAIFSSLAVGALLGAVGCWLWLGQRTQQERKRIRAAVEREYESVIVQANAKIDHLERQNTDLQSRQRKMGNTPRPADPPPARNRERPAPPEAAPAIAAGLRAVASSAPEPVDPTRTVDLPVAPAGPAQFYAPAPDVPYIEHRKLNPEPLPQLALLLTVVGGPQGTRATYQLSPAADQTRLLNVGLRQLREFFEFDMPLGEQITRLATTSPGHLERVGERWEVREKARLDIG